MRLGRKGKMREMGGIADEGQMQQCSVRDI